MPWRSRGVCISLGGPNVFVEKLEWSEWVNCHQADVLVKEPPENVRYK